MQMSEEISGHVKTSKEEYINTVLKVLDTRKILETFDTILQPFKHDKVLDIGCGIGFLSTLFDKDKYCGIDNCNEFIEFAKKKYIGYEFIQYDINNGIPFKDGEYDIVIGIWLLHHLKNWKFILEEMRRVGKKVIVIEFVLRYKEMRILNKIICMMTKEYVQLFVQNELGKGIPITDRDKLNLKEKIISFFIKKEVFIYD